MAAEKTSNLNDGNANAYDDRKEDTHGIDELFQSFLDEPMNQQFLTRLDLADAMWDDTLFSEGLY